MTRRQRWLVVLSLALVAGVVALAMIGVRRLDFFRVRAVEVVGVRYLDERAIVERLGIPADAHIMLSLDRVVAAAEALPGVRAVRATRRWPGTIRLTIREAPVVAMAIEEGQVLLIDDRAGVLPVDPARLTTAPPIAARDSVVAALLGRLLATDPQWYRVIDRAARDGAVVRLDAGPRSVRVAASAGSEVFRQLAAVREWLQDHQTSWREIDARFRGRMFVRKEVV